MSENNWQVDIHGSKDIEAHHPVHGVLSAVEIESRLGVCDDLLAALEMILDLPADKLHDAYNIASAAIAAAEKE